MKYWGRADSLFLVLIAVTASSKALITRSEMSPSDRSVTSRLAEALGKEGLSVHLEPDPPGGAFVRAISPSCKMWARDYAPYGTLLSYFRSEAIPIGPLVFIYQGEVHHRPPKVRPLVRYYLARELQRVGLSASRPPIVAVAASNGCDLKAIDWDRVAEVPW